MASQKDIDILENSLLVFGRPSAMSARLGLFGGKGNLGGLVKGDQIRKCIQISTCIY